MFHPQITPAGSSGRAHISPATALWRNTCGPGSPRQICRKGPLTRAFTSALAVLLTVIFTILAPFTGARAQDGQPGIMANGDLAVTGFSGTKQLGGQTFIDTDGASLKVLDVSGKGEPRAQVLNAPVKFQAFARDIGQVFGVALDDAPNPNIYATSTSVHGLQIVVPDENGDGVPERTTTGRAGAMFMDGQFGSALGGGPGTVWRIDGTSGEITRFADIALGGVHNSGPGLGNIAFDRAHYQFYVSDLDTGVVHSFDLSGNELATFDHGLQGRTASGLAAVANDPAKRMNIQSPAFDAINSDTWGLADERRRVWGLAYFSGRLYYSVAEGSKIWSVGINTDGSFANDARVDIPSVPGGKAVSDILFTPKGQMVLAHRGGIMGSNDYTRYHTPRQNAVLRYTRDEAGNWVQVPEEYAIGFPIDHKNASGGVGLACDGTLWNTGDALRNDPAQAASLLAGGPLVVHGLQGNDISLVRPFNVPPRASWFVDYKGNSVDENEAGHVGDVEVYRNCAGGHAESYPGWYPIPEWYPPEGWVPPVWWPRYPDLELEKIAGQCTRVPFSLNDYRCDYTIVVTNFGAADFVGHLNVVDNPPATAVFVPPPGGSIPWNCAQPGGAGAPINCASANVETLHPGESETLEITIQVTPPVGENHVHNCAILDEDHHGDDPDFFGENEDCADNVLPRPDLDIDKAFFGCEPEGAAQRCYFVITLQNVGGATYNGPLSFEETIPAGTIFGGLHDSSTAGWGCIGGNPTSCTLPNPPGVSLIPGSAEQVLISVIVPAGQGGDMENCVALGAANAGDPVVPGVNNFCEPFTSPAQGDNPQKKKNPVEHKCPAGWTKVPASGLPAGYQAIVIDGINPDGTKWGLMCMKPKPKQPVHKCPAGWTKVPVSGAPVGYQVIAVDGINPDGTKWGLMCMKPKPVGQLYPTCKPGESTYQSLRLVPKGWTSRKVTLGNRTIYCAKQTFTVPLPTCNKDETAYNSVRQIPKGWTRRSIVVGKRKIYCAKPGLTIPQPTCYKGETAYNSARQIPKGWKWRSIVVGKRKIYCAKPGSYTPGTSTPGTPKPKCVGGKLVMLKTLPPRWICKCPSNWSNVKGTCKRPLTQTGPSGIKPCPKYWTRVKGVCKPPSSQTTPTLKPCPKYWSRVNGVCKPPRLQIKPKPTLQYKPKTKLKLKLDTKPVTRLNQSTRFKLSGAGRTLR